MQQHNIADIHHSLYGWIYTAREAIIPVLSQQNRLCIDGNNSLVASQ